MDSSKALYKYPFLDEKETFPTLIAKNNHSLYIFKEKKSREYQVSYSKISRLPYILYIMYDVLVEEYWYVCKKLLVVKGE